MPKVVPVVRAEPAKDRRHGSMSSNRFDRSEHRFLGRVGVCNGAVLRVDQNSDRRPVIALEADVAFREIEIPIKRAVDSRVITR